MTSSLQYRQPHTRDTGKGKSAGSHGVLSAGSDRLHGVFLNTVRLGGCPPPLMWEGNTGPGPHAQGGGGLRGGGGGEVGARLARDEGCWEIVHTVGLGCCNGSVHRGWGLPGARPAHAQCATLVLTIY